MIVSPDIIRRILGDSALLAALATFAYYGTGCNRNDRAEGQGVDTAVVVVLPCSGPRSAIIPVCPITRRFDVAT